MTRLSDQFDDMDLDDFEELLADKPRDEKWELIGGRVVKMMVGARWEHNFIIQNLASGLQTRLRDAGSACRTLVESFRLKEAALRTSVLPDIIVKCGPLQPGASSLNDPTALIEVLWDVTGSRNGMSIRSFLHSYITCLSSETDRGSRSSIDRATAGLHIVCLKALMSYSRFRRST